MKPTSHSHPPLFRTRTLDPLYFSNSSLQQSFRLEFWCGNLVNYILYITPLDIYNGLAVSRPKNHGVPTMLVVFNAFISTGTSPLSASYTRLRTSRRQSLADRFSGCQRVLFTTWIYRRRETPNLRRE